LLDFLQFVLTNHNQLAVKQTAFEHGDRQICCCDASRYKRFRSSLIEERRVPALWAQ